MRNRRQWSSVEFLFSFLFLCRIALISSKFTHVQCYVTNLDCCPAQLKCSKTRLDMQDVQKVINIALWFWVIFSVLSFINICWHLYVNIVWTLTCSANTLCGCSIVTKRSSVASAVDMLIRIEPIAITITFYLFNTLWH